MPAPGLGAVPLVVRDLSSAAALRRERAGPVDLAVDAPGRAARPRIRTAAGGLIQAFRDRTRVSGSGSNSALSPIRTARRRRTRLRGHSPGMNSDADPVRPAARGPGVAGARLRVRATARRRRGRRMRAAPTAWSPGRDREAGHKLQTGKVRQRDDRQSAMSNRRPHPPASTAGTSWDSSTRSRRGPVHAQHQHRVEVGDRSDAYAAGLKAAAGKRWISLYSSRAAPAPGRPRESGPVARRA